jgi:uncharacterized membrane protein YcaP (DUF421 family)
MESVIRGVAVYLFLLIIFRISGKRTLAQTSPFELVLLLIISETTSQALVDSDHSITNAFLLIMTLVGMSVLLSLLKHRSPAADRWFEGLPLPIVRDGRILRERADKERVDESEILAAARSSQGLERMEDIKHAVVENDGTISVVPREGKHSG